MIVLGAHVRIRNSRYLVGFVWVDELTFQGEDCFAAPADLDEAGQLGELSLRTEGVIAEAKPDMFVLKSAEILRGSHAALAHHAEGVVLAAAGRLDSLDVRVRSRQKLARFAGSTRNAELVERLCNELDLAPSNSDCREAAAAAVGGVKESS
jgi:hypothetical protein